jgi:hypothetical protein
MDFDGHPTNVAVLEADVRESIRLFRHEVMTRQSLARSEG